MVMSTTELATFNFLKPIPNTRWQLAIRLDENYNNTILYQSVAKAITLWFILSVCMYGFYRLQRSRTKKYLSVAKEAIYSDEYDKLTALVNRTQFEKQLAEFIYQRKGQKYNGVVFQIDIDQFQLFNSSYGYTFGDALLADLSSRLTEYFSEEVVISRLGNDEFAVFAKQMEHDKAERYAENLRQFIQELPLQPLGRQVHVTACIGVVILDDEQVDSKRVLLSLGQAVAIAKSDGRNRIQLYQSEEGRLLKHAEEMRIIQSIELALRNDKFVLYRQKIASLNPSSNSHHYEVLLRMVGPDNTLISPRQIISIAEKYDLVHMIDLWVIEKTCQCILDEGHRGKYSINLSGKTLANDALTDSVTNIINRYGINPEQLAFEITETAAIGNLTSALGFIEAMCNKGHQFYLDDFGSGLSSFTYLQQLPVDVIKIDGSFVMSLFDDPVSKVLVENIHRIASAMNKPTIAECVESEKAATVLRELGIDFAQGHFFYHPEVWYQV